MARRFAKVSEKKIVTTNVMKRYFFIHLIKLKQLSPSGSVRAMDIYYIYIHHYSPYPSGDSCIIFQRQE